MSQINTGHRFVPKERNIDDVKLNGMLDAAVVTEELVSAQTESSSSATGDYFLLRKPAPALGKISFDNLASSLVATQTAAVNQQIWSARLRSFNAVGNPGFEIDQFNVGNTVTNPATNTRVQDRWYQQHTGTIAASFAQQPPSLGELVVPGTNFLISNNFQRITLTTQQVSLGAGDFLHLFQNIEGPNLRELIHDVHSISLLVRTNVAGGLKFGLSLRDPSGTKSLLKLCTISTSGTWTLIALPNLPVFPAGTFSLAPGAPGYLLGIGLAAGTTYLAGANDTWQTGNLLGAVGQDNFGAKALGSTLDIAFVQHEPGAQCTTLIDKPFTQNYDECLRYYQKSFSYAVAPGATSSVGALIGYMVAGAHPYVPVRFHRPMAKVPPTVLGYSTLNGAVGTVYDPLGSANKAITGTLAVGETGFSGFTITGPNAGVWQYQFQFTADTGW
jgi:hypothetical protein